MTSRCQTRCQYYPMVSVSVEPGQDSSQWLKQGYSVRQALIIGTFSNNDGNVKFKKQ